MKKTYITPEASAQEFVLEGVVAASTLKVDGNKEIDTNTGQLTNKYKSPWDSSQWSN